MTRAEQETIVRWDEQDQQAHLYTAHEAQAKRWIKLGYEMRVTHRDLNGKPTGWEATAEKDAVRLRRVHAGKVVRRKGHGRGQLFRAVQHDQLVASEPQASETHVRVPDVLVGSQT